MNINDLNIDLQDVLKNPEKYDLNEHEFFVLQSLMDNDFELVTFIVNGTIERGYEYSPGYNRVSYSWDVLDPDVSEKPLLGAMVVIGGEIEFEYHPTHNLWSSFNVDQIIMVPKAPFLVALEKKIDMSKRQTPIEYMHAYFDDLDEGEKLEELIPDRDYYLIDGHVYYYIEESELEEVLCPAIEIKSKIVPLDFEDAFQRIIDGDVVMFVRQFEPFLQ